MRRWLLQPVVWALDIALYFTGQLLDASLDLFDLDGDDH